MVVKGRWGRVVRWRARGRVKRMLGNMLLRPLVVLQQVVVLLVVGVVLLILLRMLGNVRRLLRHRLLHHELLRPRLRRL